MNFNIWKEAIDSNDELFDLAGIFSQNRSSGVAEQFRAVSLSISNNLLGAFGLFSDMDFAEFLNYARRSTFETANAVVIAKKREYINENNF